MAFRSKCFAFSGPPKCGCTWTHQALVASGIELERHASTKVHHPPEGDIGVPTITLVRDPCDWLRSFYQNMRGRYTTVHVVDVFQHLPWDVSFTEYAEAYLARNPGGIKRMFEAYKSDITIRLGDTRRFARALRKLGVEFDEQAFMCTKVQNATADQIIVSDAIRKAILQSDG